MGALPHQQQPRLHPPRQRRLHRVKGSSAWNYCAADVAAIGIADSTIPPGVGPPNQRVSSLSVCASERWT
jgi:hypothetical protein